MFAPVKKNDDPKMTQQHEMKASTNNKADTFTHEGRHELTKQKHNQCNVDIHQQL